jgi:hypothetical protein
LTIISSDIDCLIGFVGSRLFPKKAFKIKFNQEKGIKWKGMKRLSFKVFIR